jgi:DNA-directed RNA polymerase specialized sigma24 family protein
MRRERNVILDLLAIETAVRNHRAPRGMKPRERQAAGLQLSQLGLSASEIARIFGVTARTVHRWRARSRLTRPPS